MQVDGGHVEPGTLCVVDGCPHEAEAIRKIYLAAVGGSATPHVPMCAAHVRYLTGDRAPAGFTVALRARILSETTA